MKISTASALLGELYKKHGDIEIYMDCPHCNKSSSPDVIIPVASMQRRRPIFPPNRVIREGREPT